MTTEPLPDGPAPDPLSAPARPRAREPIALPGQVAFGLAALFAVADVVAIALAADRSWEVATAISQASIVGTIVAFVVGAFAVILRRGRAWGIVAVVLALVANPVILTKLLAVLGGS